MKFCIRLVFALDQCGPTPATGCWAVLGRVLLERGADVNAEGGVYGNALQAACARGHDKIAQILLEREANVNAEGGVYGNALQAAYAGGYDKIAQILLERGADVNAEGG
ncbi:ankyrin [Penicillium samsonianum]|uniref:ankyrin n=1 Tax=Penicillium samsonianum TaxID=1882272 RepID=UPI002546B698|nr:ankyrin [Penicillium samsonianum]KAJ6142423.1 ankyrin [Penicillium samsonianum]